MIKKATSLFLSLLMIINISLVCSAASLPSTTVKSTGNGTKYIVSETTENGFHIKTIIGAGYRFTNVTNLETNTVDKYISEYDQKYILNNSSTYTITTFNNSNYKNDRFIGSFTNTNVDRTVDVEPAAAFIYRYTSTQTNSFMRHYSGNLYELRLFGDNYSKTSTNSNVNYYSYKFADQLEIMDEKLPAVLLNVLSFVPSIDTIYQYVNILRIIVEDGLSGDLLVEALNIGIESISELVGRYLAAFAYGADLLILGTAVIDAKLFFGYVKIY